jgi:hypothetical protein
MSFEINDDFKRSPPSLPMPPVGKRDIFVLPISGMGDTRRSLYPQELMEKMGSMRYMRYLIPIKT